MEIPGPGLHKLPGLCAGVLPVNGHTVIISLRQADNFAAPQVNGWEQLVNPAAKDKQTLALLDALVEWQKEDKLFENQQLFKTPIVRNGKKATVGYQPEIWKTWE